MESRIIFAITLVSVIIAASAISIVTYEEVKDLPNHPEKVLIDVREPQEIIDSGKIPTSVNIPCKLYFKFIIICITFDYFFPVADVKKAFSDETSNEQFETLYKIKKPKFDDYLIFHCHSGRRSAVAVAEVEKLGYTKYVYMNYLILFRNYLMCFSLNFSALKTMKGHGSNGQQRKICKI